MFAGLSLDQAPPFGVPMRFFLVALLYLIAASVLMFYYDGTDFLNQSSPVSVTVVHLFSIGFMTNIMFGALFQMLPVVAGVRYFAVKGFSLTVYLLINLGAMSFAVAFLTQKSHFFLSAALFLTCGVLLFTATTFWLIIKARFSNGTAWAMRISLLSLFVALLFGVQLLIGFGSGEMGSGYETYKRVHIVFAFFGWVLMLIIGVAFQVVPMFWVTKAYPQFCKKFVLPLIGAGLIFFAVSKLLDVAVAEWILSTPFVLAALSFSTITLRRLKNRKRKLYDIAIWYWMLGVSALFFGAVLWILSVVFDFDAAILLAVLFGYGFAVSVIFGMLYKIVPFLAWFHLNAKGIFDAPTIRDFIPKKMEIFQFLMHGAGVLLLLLSVYADEQIFVFSALFISLSSLAALYSFGRVMLLFYSLSK